MTVLSTPATPKHDLRNLVTHYLRPHAAKVALLFLLLLGGIALQLSIPQILRQFIDSAGQGAGQEPLYRLAFTFLGVALA